MPEQRKYWQDLADSLWLDRRLGWSRVRESDREIVIDSIFVPGWAVGGILLALGLPLLLAGMALRFIEIPLLLGVAAILFMGGDCWRVRIGKRGSACHLALLPLAARGGRRLLAKGLLLAGRHRVGHRWLQRLRPSLSSGVACVFLVQENDRTLLLGQFPWHGWEQPEPWPAGQEPLATARHWATHLQRPLVLRRGTGLDVEVTHPHLDKGQDIAEIDMEIKLAAQEVLEEEIEAGTVPEASTIAEDEHTGPLIEIDLEAADRELEEVIHPTRGAPDLPP